MLGDGGKFQFFFSKLLVLGAPVGVLALEEREDQSEYGSILTNN